MNKLLKINPEILSVSDENGRVVLDLDIVKELDYFKGHFPQAPILAGVVQLNWAIQFGIKYLDFRLTSVESIRALKFQTVIVASSQVSLELLRKTESKFNFSYYSDMGQHSSGRIHLV